MSSKDERFMIKVVDMYYKEEMSQDAISKKLNISRATVSRTLTRAKNEGNVKIQINYPSENTIELEKNIEKKFGLKEVLIGVENESVSKDYAVALQASEYLARILKNNMKLGINWGRSMKNLVTTFEQEGYNKSINVKGVEIIPFLGTNNSFEEKSQSLRLTYSNFLAIKMAELLKCKNYNLSAPMIVSSQKVKVVIINEPDVSGVLKKAKTCDVALLGIGSIDKNSSLFVLMDDGEKMSDTIKQQGGIGEVIGRAYDENGNIIHSELDNRIIGVTLEELKQIPLKIGVGYGNQKVKAIKAALKGGLIDVLITDRETAEKLV